ncbi:MAG: hypothetical protein IJV70_04940 [Clostridia bacterium]|nr:hypothetical protein [Clostridia bacterium]
MNEEERTKEISKGKRRFVKILRDAGISKDRISLLEPLITETAWMKVKLQETREAIGSSELVVHYNNGGGQSGKRENPLFRAYESLFKIYLSGFETILNELPKNGTEAKRLEKEKPCNALAIVRAKHEKEA